MSINVLESWAGDCTFEAHFDVINTDEAIKARESATCFVISPGNDECLEADGRLRIIAYHGTLDDLFRGGIHGIKGRKNRIVGVMDEVSSGLMHAFTSWPNQEAFARYDVAEHGHYEMWNVVSVDFDTETITVHIHDDRGEFHWMTFAAINAAADTTVYNVRSIVRQPRTQSIGYGLTALVIQPLRF